MSANFSTNLHKNSANKLPLNSVNDCPQNLPKRCLKQSTKLWYHEDFPGPNKLETRSVFDFKLVLSFNCQTRVCCYFITTNCSVTSLLFCYGYIGHFGALACSFCHKMLAQAYHKLFTHLLGRFFG